MTGQIISHIIGTVIGVVVILSIELIIKVIDDSYWSTRIRERVSQDMAEIDAEEQRRRIIPEPEKPADVVVEEHEVTFYTMDNEAARLQFLYDNGVTDKEDFTL